MDLDHGEGLANDLMKRMKALELNSKSLALNPTKTIQSPQAINFNSKLIAKATGGSTKKKKFGTRANKLGLPIGGASSLLNKGSTKKKPLGNVRRTPTGGLDDSD